MSSEIIDLIMSKICDPQIYNQLITYNLKLAMTWSWIAGIIVVTTIITVWFLCHKYKDADFRFGTWLIGSIIVFIFTIVFCINLNEYITIKNCPDLWYADHIKQIIIKMISSITL
jgi:hypothetical protein